MGPYLEKAMSRVPISEKIGIKKFFCGPESFTPDLRPCRRRGARAARLLRRRGPQLDRHPHRRRPGPRASRTGSPPGGPTWTSPGMHIDRLHAYQANPEYRRTRTVESLGMVYQCHYPTGR
jgi:hypothetical protein